jgi:tryptophan synthase alpha chain
MSRIGSKFHELRRAGRKALIAYITAGDPDLDTSARLMVELERGGADIIELGVPFSDPMADGPVIQRAVQRALKRGVRLDCCLELAKEVRRKSDVPILLFSYYNPLLAFGLDRLSQRLADAGIDGVLVTDLVPEEACNFIERMRDSQIDTVFLVAPTSTDERIKLIAESSTGFIYAISRTGVTGVSRSLSEAVAGLVSRIRRFTDLPVAVGFGISTSEQVAQVWRHADGAVIGSRIVAEIEKYADDPNLAERVRSLTRELSAARFEATEGNCDWT